MQLLRRSGLVDHICDIGRRQEIHFLWRPTLADPSDEFILELAVAAGCHAIVTHNIRAFRRSGEFKVTVLTPAVPGDEMPVTEGQPDKALQPTSRSRKKTKRVRSARGWSLTSG